MKVFWTIWMMGLSNILFAQHMGPVQSVCDTAHFSRLKEEAMTLAIIQAKNTHASLKDSVELPYATYEQITKELSAIYRLKDTFPDVDTIFDHLSDDMHLVRGGVVPTYQNDLHTLTIAADSNETWVANFIHGQFPTRNDTIESMISHYSLSTVQTGNCCADPASVVQLSISSPLPFNPYGLATELRNVSGVNRTAAFLPEDVPGNDWSCLTRADSGTYVSYKFKYSFGDCNPSCYAHHYWSFKVYPDCKVEEDSSRGDRVVVYTSINNICQDSQIKVYPNPAIDRLCFDHLSPEAVISVIDIAGRLMLVSKAATHIDISALPPGMYNVVIYTDNGVSSHRFIKQ